ncbi:hypothetical protein BN988_03335 [Oceanobacillus picturae]|uniref:Uncharacterized protein n=1 Tax=Oceanobacillus picturae TaxID=171693 RepID=W9AH16_9BACI|nr:hypothetical protein BN988_03335 [Oceanobacillus picturae]
MFDFIIDLFVEFVVPNKKKKKSRRAKGNK